MINKFQECYLVITPDKHVYEIKGSWPSDLMDRFAARYKEFIVVSLYSNAVKFVHEVDEYGEKHADTTKELHFAKDVVELT
jgi:hypothetical protein